MIPLFEQIGIDCSELKIKDESLSFKVKYRYLIYFGESSRCCYLCRTWSSGYRGRWKRRFNGKRKDIYEMLDLGVGVCKFCVASIPTYNPKSYRKKRIATKYPHITSNYFHDKGEDVEIIKIEGSVEIAPILGLVDAIVDIVETGKTLQENGLVVFEEMYSISARMIVNKAALKLKRRNIQYYKYDGARNFVRKIGDL